MTDPTPLPPPGYPGPGYIAPAPPSSQQNGLGVAALVLGIVAIAIGWVPFLGWFGPPAAIAAIVLGAIGLTKVSKGQANNKAMCWVGIGLGIAALVLTLLVFVVIGLIFVGASTSS